MLEDTKAKTPVETTRNCLGNCVFVFLVVVVVVVVVDDDDDDDDDDHGVV